ncbi:HlyD family secretion protein [Pollutimonas bauzanensis]|uniref:HlyD family secretion protein n=1 Tax=Pollutimonas bauzanensis TaxID=658167 RepID=UPI00333F7FFE
MLEVIALVYGGLVWLVFIKFKLLPWNIKSQVGVVAVGLAGIIALIFILNVIAPTSSQVRVANYVVEIVPSVTGRVLEVPIEGNRLIRKGDTLLKLDPKPFQIQIKALEANLATVQANAAQLTAQRDAARAHSASTQAQLDLAKIRLGQARVLARAGAGKRYDIEQYAAEVKQLIAAGKAAKAEEQRITLMLDSQVDGEVSTVAQARAQLATAHWELEQTVILAPDDGYAINLQVRPGSYAAALPLRPVMSFVETNQRVVSFFDQNQLTHVAPGNPVEIALHVRPGQIIQGTVDSIVWANAQGQFQASGALPTEGVQGAMTPRPLQYAVRINVTDPEKWDLPMGARGVAAIYTDHLSALHLVRKVMFRASSKLDYLIFKLH